MRPPFHFDLQQFADPPAGDPPATPTPSTPPATPAVTPAATLPPATDTVSKEYHQRVQRERDDAQAKVREFEKAHADAETKRLADEGKFKEIADAAEKKAEKAERDAQKTIETSNQRIIRAEMRAQASAAGLIDADVIALIDMATVKLDDKGDVVGAKEAVDAFKAAKPHFFKPESLTPGTPTPTPGTPFIPPASGTPGGTPNAQKDAYGMDRAEYAREMKQKFGITVST